MSTMLVSVPRLLRKTRLGGGGGGELGACVTRQGICQVRLPIYCSGNGPELKFSLVPRPPSHTIVSKRGASVEFQHLRLVNAAARPHKNVDI